MAKNDVIHYYQTMEAQYFEMLQDVKDFDEALKAGIVSEEQFQQAQSLLETIKTNYERLSYIMLLLNEPRRKKKKSKFKNNHLPLYKYLEPSSKEYIEMENQDALKRFKDYVKSVKGGNN